MKKSKFAASAAAALCCASLLTAVPSAIPKADATRISYQGLTFSSGDLNFDGRINACDLILARRGLIDAFTGIPFKDQFRGNRHRFRRRGHLYDTRASDVPLRRGLSCGRYHIFRRRKGLIPDTKSCEV